MFDFLALITNKKYWLLHSLIMKFILRLYGIQVGSDFYMEGIPLLKIRGKGSNIVIGNNVSILGGIDLRNRENGKIVFKDNVTIEGNCRFVSAREGTIAVGEGSIVTSFAIINGGADLIIGRQCIIGPRTSLNANEHVFKRDTPVREAGFVHEPIYIEDDCWLAANVTVMKGVTLAKGSIVGAGAVVTKDTEPYSVNVGIPAKKVSERK
ncbi:DapH/DapD/GlmU-related protein [Desulfovibrio sp. JC010]|uniref:acyltransferase n=1 Tax=Desulfovibrio sp. JC010 TaxID=2593641 RepID=UPI0013D867A3|nr:acyltransferase [Desulfovibrio sp. JC010]NDV27185.1 acyltransferase [Desulfovibrio sp. JC010]